MAQFYGALDIEKWFDEQFGFRRLSIIAAEAVEVSADDFVFICFDLGVINFFDALLY